MHLTRSPGVFYFGRTTALCVIGIVLIGAAAPGLFRVVHENRTLDDFHVVYSGARAVLGRAEIHSATNGMYIYSPFLAFVFQPLALFPERIAAIGWIITSALIFLTAALLSSQKIVNVWQLVSPGEGRDRSATLLLAAGALLLGFTKIRSDLILGQTDCLIVFGLSLILWWLDSRPLLAAVLVGVTANFKYLSLIFVPYFIAKRNFRDALVALGSFAFFFILPVIEIGRPLMNAFALNAVAVLTKVIGGPGLAHKTFAGQPPVVNSITWNGSVSFTSSLFRLADLLHVSALIAAVAVTALFVTVLTTLVLIGRRRNVEFFLPFAVDTSGILRSRIIVLEWATLIVLALIFGPQTTARHMIILMPVYAVALALVWREPGLASRILLLALTIATAISLSFPFRATGSHPAFVALKLSGIASWCALVLMFSICTIGIRQITNGAFGHRELPP